MGRQHDRVKEVFGSWGRLIKGRTAEHLPRNHTIYTPAQAAQHLYLLTAGQVGLQLLAPEGRTLMVRVVEPGNIFGHMAITGGEAEPYDTVAETLTAARVYRITQAELAALLAHDADLALQLLEDTGQYRITISRQIDEVTFKSVPARLATLLLDMANNHDNQQPASLPRRSHRQLGEMINAYRETVTKVINQFRAARLLEIDGSTIRLVNRPRLEELAQGW